MPIIDVPLPRLPEAPQPYSFPIIATLAPVIASIAMFAITRSPFALLFAVLSPVVALGSLLDHRVQARRRAKREAQRYRAELATTESHLSAEQSRLRELARRSVRGAAELAAAPLHDPERWRHTAGAVAVSLGTGATVSDIRLVGEGARMRGQPSAPATLDLELRERLDALHDEAAVLRDAPVIVDARLGIGICGTGLPALALARGVVIQLASALSPDEFELRGGLEPWHRVLPHHRGRPAEPGRLEFIATVRDRDRGHGGDQGPESPAVVVTLAAREGELPRDCRVGVAASGATVSLVRYPGPVPTHQQDGSERAAIRAEFVSLGAAGAFAATMRAAAEAEGIGAALAEPPQRLDLAQLPQHGDAASPGLPAVFAADGAGPVAIDLVADGPHAVVGGTTGSGKSELLVSWVLALAAAHAPERLTFLLVDFKGGASFAPVEAIPHAVGLITDLDQVAAARALVSLQAELRHREGRLADSGVRSIDELERAAELGGAPLPRLLIVVDEFAAMVADFPELHAVFADVAARGRSLGVHLILCTQRPGGVLRDSVMANCTLRLSLRVNNSADSTAVIGTAAAALLPQRPAGRCYVSIAGGEPRLVQVAVAAPADAATAIRSRPGLSLPRRPWLPPLPARVVLNEVLSRHRSAAHPPHGNRRAAPRSEVPGAADEFTLGLLDVPEQQRQEVLAWAPHRDGTLLLIGGQGSGKSTLLSTLAAQAGEDAVWLPSDVEGAWDVLAALASGGEGVGGRLLLVDDLDSIAARLPEQYAHAFGERLVGVLRDGPATGLRIAVTARRLTPLMHSVATLCDARLVLRLPSRQDHVLAGGAGTDYDPSLLPGGAWWHGRRAQLALPPDGSAHAPSSAPSRRAFDPASAGALVVSTRPGAFARVLGTRSPGVRLVAPDVALALAASRTAGAGEPVVLADPQGWQLNWAALMALRPRLPLLFDRCSPADFRAIAGSPVLPPPLAPRPSGGAWLLDGEGEVTRVQLPTGF